VRLHSLGADAESPSDLVVPVAFNDQANKGNPRDTPARPPSAGAQVAGGGRWPINGANSPSGRFSELIVRESPLLGFLKLLDEQVPLVGRNQGAIPAD